MKHFHPEQLHIVVAYHNPLRFRSRERLLREFAARVVAAGGNLTIVEATLWDRKHVLEDIPGIRHVPVVQHDELWLKENMLNVGFSELPGGWEYGAWVDGDIVFDRPDWIVETIHQLQHYRIVQMFQTAVDTGPDGEAIAIFNSFGHQWATGQDKVIRFTDYYGSSSKARFWHPGFAWAINRQTFDGMGRLVDWSSLGSGDHLMALSLIGKVEHGVPDGLHPNFKKHAVIWQERAARHVEGDFGFVPGNITHHWHGRKRDRRYTDRWKILQRHQFDPERDIQLNSHGVLNLSHHGERMRNDLRRYFRNRNEDSNDAECKC